MTTPKNYLTIFSFFLLLFISAMTFSQGSETFTNLSASVGSYGAGSYTGDNGITWTYSNARKVTSTDNITGTSIGFGTSGARSISALSGANGVGDITYSISSYFTGGNETNRSIEVYVNGNLYDSYTLLAMGTDYVRSFTANETGNVTIEFKSVGSKQIVIDDVLWTIGSVSPTITVGSDITGLDYDLGSGPSTEQTTTVAGVNLTNDIVLTPPTNFEISTSSGSGFGSSINLTPSSGTVSSTTIYTRLQSGLAINSYAGNITVTSTGATSQNVALSGDVSAVLNTCLDEDFVDFSDWTNGGTSTDNVNGHFGNAAPCRGLGSGDNIISASVDNPTSLEFYQDASSGGNGNTATVDYKIGANSWVSLYSFNVTTSGNTETVNLTNVSGVDLSLESDVTFRFNSSFSTWYLDDVKVSCTDPCASGSFSISSITPTSGPANTEVTITGTGFTGATTLDMGGVNLTVISQTATEIKTRIPSNIVSDVISLTEASCNLTTSTFTVIDSDNTSCDGVVSASELFISEVTDATTGSLTYIEIYNGTGSDIADLSAYSLRVKFNAGATTNAIALSGAVLNDDVFVVEIGLSVTICTSVPGGDGSFADQAGGGNGINFDLSKSDCITLVKSGTDIDVWGDCADNTWGENLATPIGKKGVNFQRLNSATLPSLTFNETDWSIADFVDSPTCSENYDNVGTYSLSTLPILVNQSITPPSCASDAVLSVTAIEGYNEVGDTKELAYQWYEVAPGVANWTSLTNVGIYSGATTADLTISDTSSLDGYQYYCQIRENDATCYQASNTVIIDNTSDNVTWNGSWSSTPTSASVVTLDADYTTSSNGSFKCCSLILSDNVTLEIDATYVSIENDLTVNNGAILNVETSSSLIMVDNYGAVTLSGTGMINVNKTSTPYEQYDYTYWSSPIVDETIGDALVGSYANYIFYYNTANFLDADLDGFDDNQDDWVRVGASDVMSPGKGYAAMGAISGSFTPTQVQNATFSGQVNNGIIYETVATNSSPASVNYSYNLVGNPYPSAISADTFILQNPTVGGTLYFWTHVDDISLANPGPDTYNFYPDDYATYNLTGGVATSAASVSGSAAPNGYIGSGQAFFIGADTNGTVQFNNSMRDVNFVNTQFFRGSQTQNTVVEKDRIWLNLTNDEGVFNQMLVGFIEGATVGYDRLYDGEYFGGGTFVSLYSMMGEKVYTIQGLPTFNLSQKIKLGFEANIVGDLKLSIGQVEGVLLDTDIPVFLIDNETETVHNLKDSDYEFNVVETGTYNDRFEIVFQEPQSILAVDDVVIDSDKLIISNESENVLIQYISNDASKIAQLKVYDVLGRILIDKKGSTNVMRLKSNSFADGSLLIFKIQLDNGEVLSKKFIKI